MSKLLVLTSGAEVLLTQVVPDNTIITWVPLTDHGPASAPPVPDPVATLPVFLEQSEPDLTQHKPLPEPGSRRGRGWTESEILLAKSDRTDEEIALLTGRTTDGVASYRVQHELRKKVRVRPLGTSTKRWTDKEEQDLRDIAGPEVLTTEEYLPFVEFFPGRTVMALRTKHYNLINNA